MRTVIPTWLRPGERAFEDDGRYYVVRITRRPGNERFAVLAVHARCCTEHGETVQCHGTPVCCPVTTCSVNLDGLASGRRDITTIRDELTERAVKRLQRLHAQLEAVASFPDDA